MSEVFPLFGFTDGHKLVITRGRNSAEAMEHASNSQAFRRGVTISATDHLPIDASDLYCINHDDGWLYRKPLYLIKK